MARQYTLYYDMNQQEDEASEQQFFNCDDRD